MRTIEERIQKLNTKLQKAEAFAVKHGNLCTLWNNRYDTIIVKINKLKSKQEMRR